MPASGASSSSRRRSRVPDSGYDPEAEEQLGRAFDRRLAARLLAAARPHRRLIGGSLLLFPLVAVARARPAVASEGRHRRAHPAIGLGRPDVGGRALHRRAGGPLRASDARSLPDAAHGAARDPRPPRDDLRSPPASGSALLRQEPGGPIDDARAPRRGGRQRGVHERALRGRGRRRHAHRCRRRDALDRLAARRS